MPQESHIVYRAVAPNGDVYVGMTGKGLAVRRGQHEVAALSPLSRAIAKHGAKMKWEVVKDGLSRKQAADAERRMIRETNPTLNGGADDLKIRRGKGNRKPRTPEQRKRASEVAADKWAETPEWERELRTTPARKALEKKWNAFWRDWEEK